MRWLVGIAIAGVVVSALWAYAASRGWVYARGEAPRRGNVVGGLGFEQVFEPEYEFVYEEQHSVAEQADHEASAADLGSDDARP